jgi:hypothetical protein
MLRRRTVLHLHLGETDRSNDMIRLALCRGRIVLCRVCKGPLSMRNSAGSYVAFGENGKGVSELDSTLGEF